MSSFLFIPNVIRQVAIARTGSGISIKKFTRRLFVTVIKPSLFFEIDGNREVSNYAV